MALFRQELPKAFGRLGSLCWLDRALDSFDNGVMSTDTLSTAELVHSLQQALDKS